MAYKLIDRGPTELFLLQHGLNDAPKFIREVTRDAVVLAFFDLKSESQLILRLERRSKCRHFISETTQAPYVTLLVILLFVYLLRAHVVRCAYIGLSIHRSSIQNSR